MNDANKHFEIEHTIQRCINGLITALLIFAVLFCLVVGIQVMNNGYVDLFGYSFFRVITGSMEPTIPVGSLLVCKRVDMESVAVGDIICFRAQESMILGQMVTHRVTDILTGVDGGLLFETRGDANLAADGFMVSQANFSGKVIWYTGASSVLSSIVSFFSNKVGFLACVVIPILLIGGLLMKECVDNIRTELRHAMEEMEREAEPQEPSVEFTEEEYNEMYERIRAELIEELMQGAEQSKIE